MTAVTKVFIIVTCVTFLLSNAAVAQSENKYTTSLREAAEKLSLGMKNRDTSLTFPFLDSSIAFTARGETQIEQLNVFKKMMAQMFANPGRDMITTYAIEEVKAGSTEPV